MSAHRISDATEGREQPLAPEDGEFTDCAPCRGYGIVNGDICPLCMGVGYLVPIPPEDHAANRGDADADAFMLGEEDY